MNTTSTKAERLNGLIRQWIFNTVHSVDVETFMSHFAPLMPGHGRELHNSLTQGLNWFKSELESLSDELKNEYDFATKTSHLEKLTEEAKQFPPIRENERAIPTPDQAMFGAKNTQNMVLFEQLQNELYKLKEENHKAMIRHLELSREIINKQKRIDGLIQEFDKMIKEIQTTPNDELLDIMKELDVHAIVKDALSYNK